MRFDKNSHNQDLVWVGDSSKRECPGKEKKERQKKLKEKDPDEDWEEMPFIEPIKQSSFVHKFDKDVPMAFLRSAPTTQDASF